MEMEMGGRVDWHVLLKSVPASVALVLVMDFSIPLKLNESYVYYIMYKDFMVVLLLCGGVCSCL